MVEESFVYCSVARGTTVLAEHSVVAGDFRSVANQCLHKVPTSIKNFTDKFDGHVYSFLLEDGCAYCVVAKETEGRQLSYALLERIKADFRKKYGGGKADTAGVYGLEKEFGLLMKEHLNYVHEHADEIDEQAKAEEAINLKTIEEVMVRSGTICTLSQASQVLHTAQTFKIPRTRRWRKMWCRNLKIKFVVIGIIILLAHIIWLSICRGFVCSS